jgi:hypothetical protein
MKHLTPWSRVVLETLIVTHLVKKSLTFYETRRFITVYTRTRRWSLSRSRCIESSPSHVMSVTSILILSSLLCLGLPRGLFPPGFRSKSNVTLTLHDSEFEMRYFLLSSVYIIIWSSLPKSYIHASVRQ